MKLRPSLSTSAGSNRPEGAAASIGDSVAPRWWLTMHGYQEELMPPSPAKACCPQCGAPLNPGAKRCWLCHHIMAPGGAIAEPSGTLPKTRYATNVPAVLGIAFAGLARFPAAIVACFITCLARASAHQGRGSQMAGMPDEVDIFTSLGAGFVVLVGFCVLIGVLATRTTRQVPA